MDNANGTSRIKDRDHAARHRSFVTGQGRRANPGSGNDVAGDSMNRMIDIIFINSS
jgi:hypothetical protein